MAEMSKMSSFARLKLLTYLGYLILLTCLVMTSHIHAAPTCPRNVGINKVGFCLSNRSFYEWECIQCPHGLGQSIQCGRIYYELLKVHCVPCENGTSYSNSNDNGQCIKCKKCQENELKSGQCLPDKDTTKCVCKLGYYRDRGHCKPCSWCCGDKSNDHVEECKHLEKKCSYNAKSCDPTTTSAPTTTADPTTLAPKTTVPTAKQLRTETSQNKSNPFTNDSEKTVTPNDSKKTEKEHSGGKKSENNGLALQILLSFIVVVLIMIILLALVIYCCRERRSNSSDGGSNEKSSSTSNASSLAPLLDGKPIRDVNSNKSGEHVDLKTSDSSATFHAKSKGNSSDGDSGENSGSTSNESSSGNSSDCDSAPLLDRKPVRDVNSNKSGEHVDLKPSDDSSATSHAKSKALESPKLQNSEEEQSVVTYQGSCFQGSSAVSDSLCSNHSVDVSSLSKEQQLDLKVTSLPLEILSKVCARLDTEDSFFHDYRMFAEQLKVGNEDIRILEQKRSKPTQFLLNEYKLKIKEFLKILKAIEREDVMEVIEKWLNHDSKKSESPPEA